MFLQVPSISFAIFRLRHVPNLRLAYLVIDGIGGDGGNRRLTPERYEGGYVRTGSYRNPYRIVSPYPGGAVSVSYPYRAPVPNEVKASVDTIDLMCMFNIFLCRVADALGTSI
jgi:hypothetical protein